MTIPRILKVKIVFDIKLSVPKNYALLPLK